AILIPAWHEDRVIEFTVAHAIAAWPHDDLRLYVGCYRNDPATFEAATRGASGDPRVRVVAIERDGPTTKADCLNLLYAALEEDDRRSGRPFRLVGLHDAEDMVDPAALGLLDQAVATFDFVQLPVLPEPQPSSRWVGSHYCEEFAEPNCALSQCGQAVRVARVTSSSIWRMTLSSTPRGPLAGVTTMRAISLRRRGAASRRVTGSASSSARFSI